MLKQYLVTAMIIITSSSVFANYTGFQRSLNDKPWGHGLVDQNNGPVFAGRTSERFEVRQGDCAAQPGWSDCAMDRERSEMSELKPYTQMNSPTWYSWSVYFDPSWPDISPVTTTVGQFHQRNQSAPAVLFVQKNGVYRMRIESAKALWPADKQIYVLVNPKLLRNRWHNIVMNANWSTGADGFIRVWVNGVLKVDIKGPTTVNTTPVYFKYGIYRSFVSRVPNRPRHIVYIDEVRKGQKREDVDLTMGRIRPLN